MSSTAINRPPGAVSSTGRTTRFGDFTSTVNRSSVDDKISQGPTLSQSFGNGTWQASGGIWGNNAIGSGFSNGKREASRPRVTDSDGFPGTSGSGALAASSEADTWGSRNGPWNVDTTSPTISTAGSASPMIHRGSGPLILTDTSPYLSTSRPAIGQGSGLNGSRSQGKSSLDPASGPFKYPFQKPSTFGFAADDKENLSQINGIVQSLESYGFDQRNYRKNDTTSRDTSGPPSRHSENGSNGTGNGSFFTNGQYPSYGHTPHNSLQRPSTQGRVPSFPSSASGRSYTDLASLTDAESNLNRFKEAQNAYTEAPIDQPYSSPSYRSYNTQQPQSGSSGMWNNGLGSAPKGLNNYALENSSESALFEHFSSSKPARFSDRGSTSPGNDYRRQPTSPSYYQINEPSPSEPDPAFVRALRAQSVADLEHSMQRLQFAPQPTFFPHQTLYGTQFQGQFPPHAYDYPPQHNFRLNHNQYGYQIPASTYPPTMVIPRGPSRDQDEGLGFRSALLEEFRCNSKSNKRYELKDIYNHVVEFSGDQHGSRFIQQKLETANSDEKDQIFREIQPNALQLMTDVFGNYVIQKLFEHGNQLQKKALAEQMKNHVNELSVQMYGCRVVQKALEHVLADQQAELVKELQHDILKCVKDQNGNHVVQKAIERVPTADIQFIIEAFKGQVHTLATHPYGCRVIQRMLEYCSDKDQVAVLEELHACASMLITDQYGNYVMQHVIAHGKPEDRAKIIKIVTAQLLTLSKHKFASNVVEKTIQYGSDEQRRAIVVQLTAQHSDGSSPLQLMMKDQYGNYVIQKLLLQLRGTERDRFVEDMKPQLIVLKKYNYGKQITAIEKLISTGPSPPSSSHNNNMYTTSSTVTQVMPLDLNSTAVTPVLTKGQNSPESSGLSSTNASTIDEPTQSGIVKSEDVERGMPEVRIEVVQ